mgnify:CR=1 FL=1
MHGIETVLRMLRMWLHLPVDHPKRLLLPDIKEWKLHLEVSPALSGHWPNLGFKKALCFFFCFLVLRRVGLGAVCLLLEKTGLRALIMTMILIFALCDFVTPATFIDAYPCDDLQALETY